MSHERVTSKVRVRTAPQLPCIVHNILWSVSDPHQFHAYPDPAQNLKADPDPGSMEYGSMRVQVMLFYFKVLVTLRKSISTFFTSLFLVQKKITCFIFRNQQKIRKFV